ncbi:hypothetical protein POM88_038350 [Heracleum sosnowskyi]|uniref:BIRD-IDD transcription factor third C2HC zinc finger domain-containing protein n=1 Tax=Heracleum sosnowskyi TaxID=360622 RepID=A0AAD8HAI0_9APIA|nr:hypothetical protein POM88_038350 [Heracleum sosnowskyi]
METPSRKRGRPRIVVTEAVAEARRPAVQQRNILFYVDATSPILSQLCYASIIPETFQRFSPSTASTFKLAKRSFQTSHLFEKEDVSNIIHMYQPGSFNRLLFADNLRLNCPNDSEEVNSSSKTKNDIAAVITRIVNFQFVVDIVLGEIFTWIGSQILTWLRNKGNLLRFCSVINVLKVPVHDKYATKGFKARKLYTSTEEHITSLKLKALGDLTGFKKHNSHKHGDKKYMCDHCSNRYVVQFHWKAHFKTCGKRDCKCVDTLFLRPINACVIG